MKLLLDTHFTVWILAGAPRVRRLPWLARYRPWGLSPVALMEIQLLQETGRIKLAHGWREELDHDDRFAIDDLSLVALAEAAAPLAWTRDPFDRLLCAHSLARRVPLCTADEHILAHHTLLPRELR